MRLHPVGSGGGAEVSPFFGVIDRARAHALQCQTNVIDKPRVMSFIVARQQEFVYFSMNKFLTIAVAAVVVIRCPNDRFGNLFQTENVGLAAYEKLWRGGVETCALRSCAKLFFVLLVFHVNVQ